METNKIKKLLFGRLAILIIFNLIKLKLRNFQCRIVSKLMKISFFEGRVHKYII